MESLDFSLFEANSKRIRYRQISFYLIDKVEYRIYDIMDNIWYKI